jgi:hypothetical protein
MPAETPADVADLVEALHGRDLRGLADRFAYLAGVRPELCRPHQEHVLDTPLPRFEVGYDDLCVLLADAPDRCVDLLTRRLRDRWDPLDGGGAGGDRHRGGAGRRRRGRAARGRRPAGAARPAIMGARRCNTVGAMAEESTSDLLAELGGFVARIHALDPDAPAQTELTLRADGRESRLVLSAPVARALMTALQDYHDPRDQGPCDHCGSRRLDDNFQCRDCGSLNGVFGQMLAERAAWYIEPEAIGRTEGGRHSRDGD